MDLDCHELACEVDITDSRSSYELFEFDEEIVSRNCPEIRKKHF